MPVLITIRSLTNAQRAVRVLGSAGIGGVITKAPLGIAQKGCSYAVRVSSRFLSRALSALESANVPYVRVVRKEADGTYREVTA